jgi:hypothetical protein
MDLPTGTDRSQYHDAEFLIEQLARFSKTTECTLEAELGGELIGAIECGIPDDGLIHGFLEPWRNMLKTTGG